MSLPDWVAFREGLQAPAYSGKTNAEAAVLANAPDPSTPVPKTITIGEIMKLITLPSIAKLYTKASLAAFRDDVVNQNRSAIANWIVLAHIGGDVEEAEKNAVIAYLAETTDGPSLAVRTLGVPCSEFDIQAVRGN